MKDRIGKHWIDSFNPNIPTQFTRALSYLEEIDRCYRLMKEAIRELDGIEEELKAEYIRRIAELRKELNQNIINSENHLLEEMQLQNDIWKEMLQEHESGYYEKLSELYERQERLTGIVFESFKLLEDMISGLSYEIRVEIGLLQEDFIKMSNKFLKLLDDFINFKSHIQNQVDISIARMKEEIEAQLERVNGDIIIVSNPISGRKDTLKNTLIAIANWKQPIPIRFKDYNKMNITFSEYNSMEIKFSEYNNFAGLIFWERLNKGIWDDRFKELGDRISKLENEKWRDLVTLESNCPEQAYRNAVDELFNLICEPITFSEYNLENYRFNEYNSASLKAGEYDRNGISGMELREYVKRNENHIREIKRWETMQEVRNDEFEEKGEENSNSIANNQAEIIRLRGELNNLNTEVERLKEIINQQNQ